MKAKYQVKVVDLGISKVFEVWDTGRENVVMTYSNAKTALKVANTLNVVALEEA